jgi:hypothetical protein
VVQYESDNTKWLVTQTSSIAILPGNGQWC